MRRCLASRPLLALLCASLPFALAPSATAQQQPPTPQETKPAQAQEAKPTQPPQTQPPQSPPAARSSYADMLDKLKKGDLTVNFRDLRMAYTETKDYSPYGRPDTRAMFDALRAREFDKALSEAESILSKNYVNLNAHFVAFVAHRESGRAAKADFHKAVFEGLIKSIMGPGDGKKVETAWTVISTDEEYVVLNYLGLRPAGQALLHDKGHSYDAMTATDPKTNERVTYYFNIDMPFGWLGRSIKKSQTP
jgi:hypothetical protein